MNANETLSRLARFVPGQVPVVSAYVHTRAHDEHQRDVARVFLKNETRRAAAMSAGALDAELAWITTQAERIIAQALHPEAESVALFAGGPALRETVPLGVAVPQSLTVADTPRLRPLAAALDETPRTLVVFIDSERARLVALDDEGVRDETVLEHPDIVVGHHRRGGWSLLLQSKYDKHARVHRDRHFDGVVEALRAAVARYGTTTLVLAGEPRVRAVFRAQLPASLAEVVAAEIAGTQYEPAATLAARARDVTRLVAGSEQAAAVDAVLVDAGAGGRAAAGVDGALAAVNRGTVERLYLLADFAEAGMECEACAAVQRESVGACRFCGKPTRAVDLGETMLRRVLAAGGTAQTVRVHAGLARSGGVGARLRYAPVAHAVAARGMP